MTRAQLIRTISAFTAPLARRIKMLVQRSVLTRVKYDSKVRLLQVKLPGGQELADIEHLEQFGFTSHAPAGAECLVLAFGGNGSHSVGLQVGDRRYRMVIEEGDVAIYNQNEDYLHLKNDGTATLKSSTKVIVDSPAVEMTGTLKVAGATTLENTLTTVGATLLQNTLGVAGDTAMAANLAVVGTAGIAGAATLVSGATIAGISFSTHKHSYTDNGSAMTTGGAQ